ncbi:rifin PIR protein, putative [Plasmodium reichenowi]|uniref:Rifin PIR protein, putative n=1 Tax=Plasmodium reichenowi TaxID=5854 RepID=A0A2P9D6U9_PLARE|nr:rifin PIR protein, putative [Plasmodium reichenowi]
MKLHCSKRLLFVLPLNVLTTLYHEHNKNKPYITAHHEPTITSRMLSECDIQSSIYDKDADMKSVKELFDRQTSQRFQEYEERMKDKRQKRKEERDKNIQEIIVKDKMDKSLAEKVEKCCLMCGCGLGGGVLPIWGLVSGLWYATLSQYVTQTAIQKGIEAGIQAAIKGVKTEFSLETLGGEALKAVITSETYNRPMFFVSEIYGEYLSMKGSNTLSTNSFFNSIEQSSPYNSSKVIQTITERVNKLAEQVVNAAKTAEETETATYTSTTSIYSTSIIASVVTIIVIVLVMIIIYLFLRYRRKKKMNKKAQYTKLLNQ